MSDEVFVQYSVFSVVISMISGDGYRSMNGSLITYILQVGKLDLLRFKASAPLRPQYLPCLCFKALE